ncbi:unnamed protein product [Fraxinus pennsylvanica]|uniref:Uncharacterized protein n=1 Tax=Fraxinus pennsylvanica TaxID=56036 RepID=A0AAD2DMH4_9LAMI|nr:unnamed protein product [Fraxinus pennsylvanica]
MRGVSVLARKAPYASLSCLHMLHGAGSETAPCYTELPAPCSTEPFGEKVTEKQLNIGFAIFSALTLIVLPLSFLLTINKSLSWRIIASLPRLCDPSEIHTESVSLAEEAKADAISAVINQRDVPNWDIPLHLAVKFGDDTVIEMLMLAGADWNLQNEHG